MNALCFFSLNNFYSLYFFILTFYMLAVEQLFRQSEARLELNEPDVFVLELNYRQSRTFKLGNRVAYLAVSVSEVEFGH